jgi:DNA polymerase/3'-5' exonuclease PolX
LQRLYYFKEAVDKMPKVKGDALGKYTQRRHGGFKIDIFMVNLDNWGNLFAMRTGPVTYSRKMAKRWVEMRYRSEKGYLYKLDEKDRIIPQTRSNFKTEEEFFEFLGWDWIPPKDREGLR